jgi:hypothetical protein
MYRNSPFLPYFSGFLLGVNFYDRYDFIIFSHHRCHNHFLAAGGSSFTLFAELLGRIDGCSGGRGGSVHLVDREKNFLGTSPILTQAVAFATGAAFAFKHRQERRAAIVFFGDAAFEEGAIVHTGEDVPSEEQAMLIGNIPSLRPIVDSLIDGDDSAASVAAAVEFILEGMHLSKRLNKDTSGLGGGTYRAR